MVHSDMPSNMSVTILGSGTCVPSLERSSCAVLVEIGTSKVLIDSGADVNIRNEEGYTPLHWAAGDMQRRAT